MTTLRPGDAYCPRCGEQSRIGLDFTHSDHFWFCDCCKHVWRWDHDGVDWIWPDDVDKPSAGCPWCGTQNIRCGDVFDGDVNAYWSCQRDRCRKRWQGNYTVWDYRKSGGQRYFRWKIRIPARDVPFRRTLDNPTTYPHHQETL